MGKALFAIVVSAMAATTMPAQTPEWGNKLFTSNGGTTTHDFGSVPRGAQLYHRFPMKNIWAVPIELMSIRTSCGCVTPTPNARTLQPRESGYLEVMMDGRRFTGQKTVTIYILIGPEYTSTATLQVSANCRADVVFNPGEVNFGVVPAGQTPVQNIDVEYAGTLDWRVSEVVKNDAPLDVVLEEWYRKPGNTLQVGYHVRVTMKPSAPPGNHKWELLLKTNDPASQLVPLLVEATVQASLNVSPNNIRLDKLKVGEEVTRRVVMSGSKPFKITSVDGQGDGVHVDLPGTPASRQFVTIKFRPSKSGDLHRQLHFKTDLENDKVVTVSVDGTIDQ